MSVLRPESLAILAKAREGEPMFTMMAAELFDAKHTIGPYKVLPTTTGTYIVFDTRAPLGKGKLSEHPDEGEAHEALVRVAMGR